MLLARHNAALVLHQVLLGQATASVPRSAVPHLCLGAHCHACTASLCHGGSGRHVLATHLLALAHGAIIASAALSTSLCHGCGVHVLHHVLATSLCHGGGVVHLHVVLATSHVLHHVLATHLLTPASHAIVASAALAASHCSTCRTVREFCCSVVHLAILMNSIFLESYMESRGTRPSRIAATNIFIRATS